MYDLETIVAINRKPVPFANASRAEREILRKMAAFILNDYPPRYIATAAEGTALALAREYHSFGL